MILKTYTARKTVSFALIMALMLSLLPIGLTFTANAAPGDIEVRTGAEFAAALQSVANGGVISIENDIDAVSTSTISSSKSFTIEGNGHKITQTVTARSIIRMSAQNSAVTVRNLHFDGNGFSSNFSYGGGAIATYRASITIENCIFENLYASSSGEDKGGGAIMLQGTGTLTVKDSTFINNRSAYHGGAIFTGGRSTIVNSTFYGNSATRDGGAIYATQSGTLINNTIVNNTSTRDGGGVRNNSSSASSQTQLRNNIIIGNTCGGSYSGNDVYRANDQGYNLIGNAVSLSTTNVNTTTNVTNTGWLETGAPKDNGNIPGAILPQLTIALLPTSDSPAINKGLSSTVNSVAVPTTDQRGYTRIGEPDIGAYEYSLIEASHTIKVGEVYDLTETSPLAKGLFGSVVCTPEPGWESIIEFDPDSNELVKGLSAGVVTIEGYVGPSKYIEIELTVEADETPNKVTSFSITDAPTNVYSEIEFDILYAMATEAAATDDVVFEILQADGSPLPENVALLTEDQESGKLSLTLVNEAVNDVYSDIPLKITVKSAYDFTFRETKFFTLKKPQDTAIVNVSLSSNTYTIKSEGNVALDYTAISLGAAAADPTLIWTFTASNGIAVQGITQNMETPNQAGILPVDIRNRSSSTRTLTITATSRDNPYRSASVTILVQGESNDVYTYDQLYQAVLAAQDGDVISIKADLIAKKVVQVDGITSASIASAQRSLQSTITLKNDMIIEGNGHTIDGQGYYSIFFGISGTTTFKNLTITNAENTNTGSQERNGVAICLKGGHAILENVTLVNNACSVGNGGGVYVADGSTAVLKNCTIANNKAKNGGGISIDRGSVVLENTIITANRADTNGDNLYYTANTTGLTELDGGYNIIYDIYFYGPSGSRLDITVDFPYNAEGTTINKNSLDVYASGWLTNVLGNNGGGAKTLALIYHPDSPAIDRIPAGRYPEYDQRGLKRTGLGDIGAYEYLGITEAFTLSKGSSIFIDEYHADDAESMLILDSIATWSTSNRNIATVTSGYITAHSEGSAIIRGFDGSGSEVVTVNVYVGNQSVASVDLNANKTNVDSGEDFALTYTVNAGASTDKRLAFKAELFDRYAWEPISEVPDEIEIIGLMNTTDATGVMPLSIINQWNKDAVIRITAVSMANGSVAGTIDVTVKKEDARSVALSADISTVASGQPLTITYALDASPSYESELTWSFSGTDIVIPVAADPVTNTGTLVLYPIATGAFGSLTIELTETGSLKTDSVTVAVTQAVAPDAVTSASIVNIAQLRAASPLNFDSEIVSYYAISDDIKTGYTWEFIECDPEDHSNEFALTVPVMVSVDGGEAFPYTTPFTTDNQNGSISFTVPSDPLYSEIMLVLSGSSVPFNPGTGELETKDTGYHYLLAVPQVIAVTGVTLDRQTLSMQPGNNVTLNANISPTDATDPSVTWVSSNPNVATVGANGLVTAKAAGTATITVKTVDGDFSATCAVTVASSNNESNTTGGGGGGGGSAPSGGAAVIPPVDVPTNALPFTDVATNSWYYDSVNFVCDNGLFAGTSDTTFSPDVSMTRAMMVTVLYRLAGSPETSAYMFTDVPADAWYANAVNWAATNGIVNGIGDNKFDPNANITREQMAVILYNYAKAMGIDLPSLREALTFADADAMSNWAIDAISAMYKAEVLNGKGNNIFDAQGNASRAEVATMFMNFIAAIQ